ncbi:OmpA family protein [Qipengyuania atrilutea]|uniref:OmpA family protein n=1 Tax=Qipengyuania atrilutea TaxID=2744473 RepID=A0A850H7H1_9SPHN|nr:OmpA family protein [Actirhodobacter atriluteus]NVD45155.1 OmpA family protein [Actirhodobacter atriluteus]
MRRLLLAATVLAGLSACDRDRERDGPLIGGEESIIEEEEPVTDVPRRSIFREDVEQPDMEAAALEPLRETISFAEGQRELDTAARAALVEIAQSPQFRESGQITLRGHTDSGGNDEVNLRASERRANLVRDWLVEHGVDEERITVIAMGEQNPVEPNAMPDGTPNEAGRRANRRVEVHIAVPEEDEMAETDAEEDEAAASPSPSATGSPTAKRSPAN